jgi:dCTP diphosphatase
MGQILFQLAITASSCRLDLRKCIHAKLDLNEKKYPVELCKGKSGKYTAYSDQTGITKTVGQETNVGVVLQDKDNDEDNDAGIDYDKNNNGDHDTNPDDTFQSPELDATEIDAVQLKISKFADDRLWNRFHTPRNLVLALIGELGELAELYQWRGEKEDLTGAELEKVGQEIADVAIYLLRLATVCRVKIGEYTVEACANMALK